MELIRAYLQNINPFRITEGITALHLRDFMREQGWRADRKSSDKYQMLVKRYKVDEEYYRVIVRFEKTGVLIDEHVPGETRTGVYEYKLSQPAPFVITKCESFHDENGIERWKDIQTFHGPKLKDNTGFTKAGVPYVLLEDVQEGIAEFFHLN